MSTVAVIDYGMGNLHSVASALRHVAPECNVVISGDEQIIGSADRVIFPGVGAIRDCMSEIRAQNIDSVVNATIESGKPLLAICVGLQALMSFSEENSGVDCLGFFAGQVRSFSGYPDFNSAEPNAAETNRVNDSEQLSYRAVKEISDLDGRCSEHRPGLKVPHMGWNQVAQQHAHPLWHNIPDGARFYFVHSYCAQATEVEAISGTCCYGIEFSAALARHNVFASQFHPEKSHIHGLQLLKNFVSWDGKY